MLQGHMTRLAQTFLPPEVFAHATSSNGQMAAVVCDAPTGPNRKECKKNQQVSTSDVEFTLGTKLALGCEDFPLFFTSVFKSRCGECRVCL